MSRHIRKTSIGKTRFYSNKFGVFFYSTLALIVFPVMSNAQMIISEIMYDLAGTDSNEWVEIQNISTTPIDISTWKFFEGNSNHTLKVIQGNGIVPPNGFAIIVNSDQAFLSEFSSFQGILLDSSFSLSNTGETLSLRNSDGLDIDTVSYISDWGAVGDGNSLQKIVSNWNTGAPTPGLVNSATPIPVDSSNETSSGESTPSNQSSGGGYTYSSSAKETTAFSPQSNFAVSIGKDKLAPSGSPVYFEAEAKFSGAQKRGASFLWTLGDGAMKGGQGIVHHYKYPGDYVVVLNASYNGENVVTRVNVRVFEPELSFSVNLDGSISILNLGKDEINLYNWSLEFLGKVFKFPQDTIIKSHKTVTISSEVLGFIALNAEMLQVKNPIGEIYIFSVSKLEEENFEEVLGVSTSHTPENRSQVEEVINIDKSSSEEDFEIDTDVKVTAKSIEITKPKGMWSKIKGFFSKLFD